MSNLFYSCLIRQVALPLRIHLFSLSLPITKHASSIFSSAFLTRSASITLNAVRSSPFRTLHRYIPLSSFFYSDHKPSVPLNEHRPWSRANLSTLLVSWSGVAWLYEQCIQIYVFVWTESWSSLPKWELALFVRPHRKLSWCLRSQKGVEHASNQEWTRDKFIDI